jgi:hypothetical protein
LHHKYCASPHASDRIYSGKKAGIARHAHVGWIKMSIREKSVNSIVEPIAAKLFITGVSPEANGNLQMKKRRRLSPASKAGNKCL